MISPSGQNLPFARNGYDVHFFAPESGVYRIAGPDGSATFVANVPPLPTARWKPTAEEMSPVESEPTLPPQRELWRWLVVIALIALWLEWQLFYFARVKMRGYSASRESGIDPEGLLSFGEQRPHGQEERRSLLVGKR